MKLNMTRRQRVGGSKQKGGFNPFVPDPFDDDFEPTMMAGQTPFPSWAPDEDTARRRAELLADQQRNEEEIELYNEQLAAGLKPKMPNVLRRREELAERQKRREEAKAEAQREAYLDAANLDSPT
jgi:hypothetical protein